MTAPARSSAATTSNAAVRFDDVAVRFVTRRKTTDAVAGVTLDVAPGEFVAVLGPSGCGKSTLLKVAAGLVRPFRGSAQLLGRTVTAPQREIGFVFQRAALLEWRSTRGNILLQAEIRRMDRRDAEKRADELMELTGLRGFENAYPYELSGGMQHPLDPRGLLPLQPRRRDDGAARNDRRDLPGRSARRTQLRADDVVVDARRFGWTRAGVARRYSPYGVKRCRVAPSGSP